MTNFDDTIVAQASANGQGLRAIIRLSGSDVRPVVAKVVEFQPPMALTNWQSTKKISTLSGIVFLGESKVKVPIELLIAIAPFSYTSQDVVEIYLPNLPPFIDDLIAQLIRAGGRPAQPGEFTLRAFLSGKRDLTRAEAVHAVIEATSRQELTRALKQLGGNLTDPLQELRSDLLNLLADLEAGLDFSEEDITFVQKKDLLLRLGKALAYLMNLRKQLGERGLSNRPFRVVLCGNPNVGKSTLFNRLSDSAAALVSAQPGTTRDYLYRRVTWADGSLELIDTPGEQIVVNDIERQAQQLREEQMLQADLLLWCADSQIAPWPEPISHHEGIPVIMLLNKWDHPASEPSGWLATSSHTGFGIEKLKNVLIQHLQKFSQPALASSWSRCQGHIDRAILHLRQAHASTLFDDPSELMAVELRLALDQIGEMVGAVYTDDLLDRIFSRFCIGK